MGTISMMSNYNYYNSYLIVLTSYRYGSLKDEDLLDISMEDLAAPGCVVVVWVTNRMKHIKFVKDILFPQWSVTCVAEWQWLKVCVYYLLSKVFNFKMEFIWSEKKTTYFQVGNIFQDHCSSH